MAELCPVCETKLRNTLPPQGLRNFYECPRCGPYSLSNTVLSILEWNLKRSNDAPAKVSHALYRMSKQEQWALLTSDQLKNIIEKFELPRPQEQFENLILWLGQSQASVGVALGVDDSVRSAVGAIDKLTVHFLVAEAIEAGFVDGVVTRGQGDNSVATLSPIKLSLKGWGFFEELQRGKASGRNAFMAMEFGHTDLDKIVEEHFKPAVKATGFDLKPLNESQPAGLIDDRMRVEIRQSRFLIADLTHQNRGAYWEAGYAEGLGKFVIYTCRKDIFDTKTEGTHFDTNHHLTVLWEPDKLPEAAEKLKATIRATLPEEAKLSD